MGLIKECLLRHSSPQLHPSKKYCATSEITQLDNSLDHLLHRANDFRSLSLDLVFSRV